MDEAIEAERFRSIFRRAHAGHAGCLPDEWLMSPCQEPGGARADRPIVWSRRNGRWGRVDALWVGAAPGNAGGLGSGAMGAHGTRIPFGGDVAGANLDVLLSAVGLDRNRTFVVAALNHLPARGGGEPRVSELRAPVGELPSSVALLRETILASGPRLLVALGNVAVRSSLAAAMLAAASSRLTLPGLSRVEAAGVVRGEAVAWPTVLSPDDEFRTAWSDHWGPAPLPRLLWLLHPSAQNMSPYAGEGTVFHTRMVETVAALRRGWTDLFDRPVPVERPRPPSDGIYALPEWRDAVGPRHEELDALWRERGV